MEAEERAMVAEEKTMVMEVVPRATLRQGMAIPPFRRMEVLHRLGRSPHHLTALSCLGRTVPMNPGPSPRPPTKSTVATRSRLYTRFATRPQAFKPPLFSPCPPPFLFPFSPPPASHLPDSENISHFPSIPVVTENPTASPSGPATPSTRSTGCSTPVHFETFASTYTRTHTS